MGWTVFGEPINTADFGAQSKFQKFRLNSNQLLLAVRTWIIFYNNPSISGLRMEIWSNNSSGTPGRKLFTSETLTKAQMITLANGVKEVPFIFNDPFGVVINGSDWYHLILNGDAYTGDDTSHIAWMKALPDPAYSLNYSPSITNVNTAPYLMSFFGAPYP